MEDIFDKLLENDDIERVEVADEGNIENEDPNDNTNSVKRKVKVTHTVNKRPTLDISRLTGQRGIASIEKLTEKVSFKGKGHEKDDLSTIISCLHYWTHRLYPKMTFEDCLEKIENLGKKRPTQIYLNKLRTGMLEESMDNDKEEQYDDNQAAEFNNSALPQVPALSEEQKQRMLQNRILAQERRAAKMKAMDKAVNNNLSIAALYDQLLE